MSWSAPAREIGRVRPRQGVHNLTEEFDARSRYGINGFGRIGRQVLKAVNQGGFSDLFEIVAVSI